MSIRSVPGQEHVAEAFERIFENDRLGHAYVFAGPRGVGKSLFARELAKALLCEEKPLRGCDRCNVCHRVESGNHPDVHWYRPPEGKRIFPIDIVRDEIIHTMGLKPFEGSYKVFIIEPAEMMNEEAANCLLKTLEEPPAGSLLVLLTTAPNRLLPTIRSRCQLIRFRTIPRDVLARHLRKALGIGEEEARNLAHLSGGSLAAALSLHESDGLLSKNEIVDRFLGLKPADNFALAEDLVGSAPAKSTLEQKREHLYGVLNLVAFFYRDMLASASGSDVPRTHRDRARDLAEQGERLGADRVAKVLEAILRAQEEIFLNANMELVLASMATEIADVQRTGPASAATVPS